MLMQLLLSLASGKNFGPFRVPEPRTCLLVDTELSVASLHRRIFRMAKTLGVSSADVEGRLFLLSLKDNVPPPVAALDVISSAAMSYKASVVAVDSLYSFSNGREDGEDSLGLVKLMREIRRRANCATICMRHDGKGLHSEKEVIDRGAGHSVLSRDADALGAIDLGEEPDTFLLRWSVRDYAPPGEWGCEWYEGAFVTAGAPVVAKKASSGPSIDSVKGEAVSLLAAKGNGATAPVSGFIEEVKGKTGVGVHRVRSALSALVSEGSIVRLRDPDEPRKEVFQLPGFGD
jgi:hypothetical protein